MSTVTDKTWDVFMTASLSDDDLGYPDKVAFVPGDQDWADEVVWRNLTESRPTVVVNEKSELLLVPLRRSLLDRMRRRVTVNFGQRVNGHAPTYTTTSHLSRHPLRDMREMSLV